MVDLYHAIYDGEIFQKTHCIEQENNLMDFFRNVLTNLGYSPTDTNRKIYQREHRKVVICLVDDIVTCTREFRVPYCFDKDTTVITDNWINCPTQYKVLRLPDSFFGIYSYSPNEDAWQPDRRFTYSVNRIDDKRLTLFLELAASSPKTDEGPDFEKNYVNFNCWSWIWAENNSTDVGLRTNFLKQFRSLNKNYQTAYNFYLGYFLEKMPYKNYDGTLESVHTKSWVNAIVETYSSDTTVALSEKTFRALVTPAPWILYAGKHAVARLNSLGFDTINDLVNHRYDSMLENFSIKYGDKSTEFIADGAELIERLQSQDFATVSARFKQAAEHNQQLLANMKSQWPADFAAWLPEVIEKIK